jgi:hypothetical protein
MHLGLIDGPSAPHNFISAQESPVPLPKFQMAPRLKTLMSSGNKKGTQIYYPFVPKVLASKSPPGSPLGPLWREMPISKAFLNISSRGALPTEPLQRETLHSYSPVKGVEIHSLVFAQNGVTRYLSKMCKYMKVFLRMA